MEKEWKKVNDIDVQHVWVKDSEDDCGEGPNEVYVSPDWYQENGTPICYCGLDMVYSHTEVKQ